MMIALLTANVATLPSLRSALLILSGGLGLAAYLSGLGLGPFNGVKGPSRPSDGSSVRSGPGPG